MRLPSIMVWLALAACSKAPDAPAKTEGSAAPRAAEPAVAKPAPAPPATPKPTPIKGPAHGQTNWAVFAYAGPAGAQADAVKQALVAKGLEDAMQFGELLCHEGAAEALKLPPDSMAVSLHFATEPEAKAFAATLASPPTGIAQVKQGCAD